MKKIHIHKKPLYINPIIHLLASYFLYSVFEKVINHRIHLGLQRTFASNAVLKHIQRSLGNSGFMSAILISLSKVYDSLPHYLFTVNLVSHSFQNSNLFQIHHVIYLVKNKLGSCIANLLILICFSS